MIRAKLRTFLTWSAYPSVMLASLVIYFALASRGVDLGISSNIAATIGGFGLVTLLEIAIPYRREWLPSWSDLKVDFLFMVLIQILLPYLLTILSVAWLVDLVASNGWNLSGYWPRHYPIGIQMLLMMFAADFLRYWLHLASHTYGPLWRIHAVHHSVQKLYWFNVGRFHPFDKSLQFVCDVLPFIFLGVAKEVMTLYFVVYAVNGFFQHSNVDAKLGWFNYLVSGPELHRWHHSKTIQESNNNYGNNVIVWDILFGTYFLPKDRKVADLGLLNRNYPMGFFEQIKAPFLHGIDKEK